jgi:transcriptional regulator with XRE-family HTH domain
MVFYCQATSFSLSAGKSLLGRYGIFTTRMISGAEGREFASSLAGMPDEDAPFLTRRARLLLGKTQAEFAEMFEVEDATVSRWERGKLHPSAKVWPRIREIALRSAIPLSDEVVREAHVYKFIVAMNDLTRPSVVSKGAVEALVKAGIKRTDLTASWWSDFAHRHPHYEISTVRGLETVQADKRWLMGEIAFADIHAFSTGLNRWLNVIVAPLPDRNSALIEAVESLGGEEGGFRVHLVHVNDLIPPK